VGVIDFILNVAGLLLWLSWRAIRFDPLIRATPATLAGTVRRAEPSRLKRWHFLAALVGLVFVRAIFYWQIGPAVNWTPTLDLGVVALAFPGHLFSTTLLYSTLSFVHVWVIFQFWLIALLVISGPAAKPNPFQKLIALQLGRIAHWPWPAQLLIPGLVTALLWLALYPLLAYAGIIHRSQFIAHIFGQSAVLGLGIYFTLKNLLPVFLFLHLVATYIYLGSSPLWEFISSTARKILAPLNRLPLRYGKLDFAPLAGIFLILLLLQVLPNLVNLVLAKKNLTLWPE
jgi:uncharacterized protein YggT (Ycf19 family)